MAGTVASEPAALPVRAESRGFGPPVPGLRDRLDAPGGLGLRGPGAWDLPGALGLGGPEAGDGGGPAGRGEPGALEFPDALGLLEE